MALLTIHAPDDAIDHWWADGDLRMPGTGWADDNYRYTDALMAKAKAEGLAVEADPESACSFFDGSETALRRLAEIADEVVPSMWGATAQSN